MSLDIIENRLNEYSPRTKQDEINALKEICQEIALSGLARSNFFKQAAFQGGTCLRILFALNRFSEDLDFILQSPQKVFVWEPFLKAIELEFESFGLELQVLDRSRADANVKRAFLKQNSFGKILTLKHQYLPHDTQSIRIKLEIDINPPQGSLFETHFLDYPYPFSILAQDTPSLFAGKCHALLCRSFVKGRDWFDFIWYVSKKTQINYPLLKNALDQFGPYKGKTLSVDKAFILEVFNKRIQEINWKDAKSDIEMFLGLESQKLIENWNKELFLALLKKMENYLL